MYESSNRNDVEEIDSVFIRGTSPALIWRKEG
jgi:hypothetical protein